MPHIAHVDSESLESMVLPYESRLMLALDDGSVHGALIDSGAVNTSCIDVHVANSLGVHIESTDGELSLADQRMRVPRIGIARGVHAEFLYMTSEGEDRPPMEFSHDYEVIDMGADAQYTFIIGTDLIGRLFPHGVPLAFICHAEASTVDNAHAPMISTVTPALSAPPPSTQLDEGYVSLSRAMIQSSAASASASASMNTIDESLQQLLSSSFEDGVGALPEYERPHRTTLSTAAEVEDEYRRRREEIMKCIQPLLDENASITGFCTLPESVVKLHVDPTKKDKLFRRPYPIPQAVLTLVREVIQRWYDTGRITDAPPNCPYNNPLTVAPKKDEHGRMTGIRVCLDTRLLNDALLVTDSFPLPRINGSFEVFTHCLMFGELDLAEAYLQFRLDPDSQQYTAFTFEGRQYMFVGCPFGIKSLPGYYQRIISRVFHGYAFTRPYIDNLPFGSRTWREHQEHAIALLTRLNECNLKVKPSSVKLGYSSLRILGHQVSLAGVGLDPDKLAALASWERPRTGPDMERFLGFVGFLQGNVRHFNELTAPLQAVKHEKVIPYASDDPKQCALTEAFETVKAAVLRAPLLQLPDFDRPFHLATDASNVGVGAVLFQPRADGEFITPRNIVGIYSHKLTRAEKNYPAYRKELLAIVRALTHFHYYLWGRAGTVLFTDHKPLTYIQTSPQLSPALEQWLDVINNYSFAIVHRPGKLNVAADQLSRMYSAEYAPSMSPAWGIPGAAAAGSASTKDSWDHDEEINRSLLAAIEKDMQRIATARGMRPRTKDIRIAAVSTRRTRAMNFATEDKDRDADRSSNSDDEGREPGSASTRYSTHVLPSLLPTPLQSTLGTPSSLKGEGCASASTLTESKSNENAETRLLVELEKRGKSAPPEAERSAIVHKAHLEGHFGRDAVFNNLYSKGTWWPGMRAMIDDELRNCDACIRFVVGKAGYHPAESIRAMLPGDHWQMDCSSHMPVSPDGHTAILHVVDVYTGMVLLLRAMFDITAESVAAALVDLIALIGPPKILQSDNGPEFSNDVIRALVKLLGVKHRFISPYNPRADGKVERSIGTTVMIVKKLVHGTRHHWPLFLPYAQITFNNKISSLTGSTPFALFFGRRMNELRDYSNGELGMAINLDDWREHQEKLVSLVYPAMSDRMHALKDDMTRAINKHRRLLTSSLPTGAIVMVKDPNRREKFEAKYIGPYTIIRRAHNGAYVLRDQLGDILDRHVPADQLKLISKTSRASDEKDAGNVYEVDYVADHRLDADTGAHSFLTFFKGYADPEWTQEANFNETDCIAAYWKRRRSDTRAGPLPRPPPKAQSRRRR